MEELKNCKVCGKIFQTAAQTSVCPICVEQDEDDFIKIREYLYDHPHASMYEVATNLDITINRIKHYLREGRIEIVEKDNQFLSCETCGKPIHTGWYCDDCQKQQWGHNSKQISKQNQLPGSSIGSSNAGNTGNPSSKGESKINYKQQRRG